MATFVANLETELQGAAQRLEPGARNRERGFGALLAVGLTLFAVAIDGYHPYAEDGGLYIAGVKRLLDPTLYPQGTGFVLEPMRWSLFAPALAEMVRLSHLGLPAMLLVLHLASVWTTLFAAWMLAGRCWKSREARTGAVVLLACWLSLPVAGTALLLMDPYLTARSFSTPCMVLALVGVLDSSEQNAEAATRRRGLALWALSIAIAAAIHPLMAAHAAGATLMLAGVRSRKRSVRLWGTVAMGAAALALATCVQAMAKPESANYVRVALTRTYWFPAQWRWYELVGLVAPLAILAAEGWLAAENFRFPGATFRPPTLVAGGYGSREQGASQEQGPVHYEGVGAARALARMSVVIGVTAWLAAVLFARAGAATHLVARMQPLRVFQIVYLVMAGALGAKLGELVLRRSLWRWGATMILLGGVMFVVARESFPASDHLELPGMTARNPWVEAFGWIRRNIPKDALFALDSDYINARQEDAQCFRAIAERSALPDYSKDGGEASIAPELAAEWQAGQVAQQGLSGPPGANAPEADTARIAHLNPLGVSWVVMETSAKTNFDCPYENGTVKVCRLH